MFERLKCKLKNEYKPYIDKGKKAQKERNLRECAKEVLHDLKQTARTREQSVRTAKMLYRLVDLSLRLNVENELLQPGLEQFENVEIEPEISMKLG